MTPRAMLRVPARLVGGAVLLTVLAAPVYLFVRLHAPQPPGRADPPRVVVAAASLATVPPYSAAVPVLAYHDISSRPGRYAVAPRTFAEQIDALHLAGFHTISAAQMLAFLDGSGSLPKRPILIVFYNGLASAWRVADPILEQFGFRAVSFVDDERVGKHGYYYLGADELRAMVRSRRWDIEVQAGDPRGAIDGSGDLGSTLSSRLWVARAGRPENAPEFTERVSGELHRSADALRALGADPVMLGYALAPSALPSDDTGAAQATEALVARQFSVSFADGPAPRFIDRYDRSSSRPLPAMVVEGTTTAAMLVDHLAALAPVAPHLDEAIAAGQPWVNGSGGANGSTLEIRGHVLTLRVPPGRWDAAYWGPGRSALWHAYRASVTIQGLAREGSGASATLLVGGAGEGGYAVSISAGRMAVAALASAGRSHTLMVSKIREASQHRLIVTLQSGHLQVSIDGRGASEAAVAGSTHGGIGLGSWRASPNSPTPSFTKLSVDPLS